jgi:hypothetical protein
MNRREFVGKSIATTAAGTLLGTLAGRAEEALVAPRPAAAPAPTAPPEPAEFARKIKIGVVGCGGRGDLIAKRFKEHGGYAFQAVADYFHKA